MTSFIEIQGTEQYKALRIAIKDLTGKAVPKSDSLALNRIMPTIRSRITKSVSARTGVTPQKHIRNRMKITKKPGNKNIRIITGDMPAGLLNPKQLRSGVRAGRNRYDGAFLINTPGKVSQRVYKREGRPRYPIEQQRIELESAFKAVAMPIAEKTLAERYPIEFERALTREAQRIMRRRLKRLRR